VLDFKRDAGLWHGVLTVSLFADDWPRRTKPGIRVHWFWCAFSGVAKSPRLSWSISLHRASWTGCTWSASPMHWWKSTHSPGFRKCAPIKVAKESHNLYHTYLRKSFWADLWWLMKKKNKGNM
jgi:hypothetical protein